MISNSLAVEENIIVGVDVVVVMILVYSISYIPPISQVLVFCVLSQTTKHLWLAMLLCCGGDLSLFTPVINYIVHANSFLHGIMARRARWYYVCYHRLQSSVVSYAPLLWW